MLYDADPVIAGVWDYLIHVQSSEIMALPTFVEDIRELTIPQEARWLIGFWLSKGTAHPRPRPSLWMKRNTHTSSYWGMTIKERIASQISQIRHWKVYNKSYTDIPKIDATWYVDPPYIEAGKNYRYNKCDYAYLGAWCDTLPGQVIVCEQDGAKWLSFQSFRATKAMEGCKHKGPSMEALYYVENNIISM